MRDESVSKPAEPHSYLSLGAGVQSSAMLLALQTGDLPLPDGIPMPKLAIFADTGWEPPRVYRHLRDLKAVSGIPIQTVKLYEDGWSLRDDLVHTSRRNPHKGFTDIPAFYKKLGTGEVGLGKRQCTSNWKIRPIESAIRRDLGVHRLTADTPVRQFIGISRDEPQRIKPNQHSHIENVYPLVDAHWDRLDCREWMRDAYPHLNPAKSACIGCPFHGDYYWRAMNPEERADAIEVDEAIRHLDVEAPQFLHKSARPLADVLLDLDAQPYLFPDEHVDECGGICMI